MEGSEAQKQEKKKVTEVTTFTVPFALGGIKENIAIKTISTYKSSKEQIMNQAIQFHLQGQISEAAKYYQYFIDQGFNNHRVFSNYGVLLKDLGKLKDAELLTRKAIQLQPDYADAHYNLGIILKDLGKLKEAEISQSKAIELNPDFVNAHYNLGNILRDRGKLKDAEILYRKVIKLKPDLADAHLNLGSILRDLDKFKEAELSTLKAIEIDPNLAEAHSNLGNLFRDLGNLQEAELSQRKAIQLKPDLADAHLNLGSILKDLGKLKEAELSTRTTIELQPDHAKAHSNLGLILRDLGNLEEAELYSRKAIQMKSDFAISYQNLSILFYAQGNINLAVKNIEKAYSIDPLSKDNQLLLSIFRDRKRKKYKNISNPVDIEMNKEKAFSYPVILKRSIDPEIINSLYKIKALDLNKFKDPSFGNARGSDYKLFENNEKTTSKLQQDLTSITKEFLNSNVFFRDSFFTILGGNSTINKHNHIGSIDKLADLCTQKYALVYYLSIGDQNCKHPGILKFYKHKNDVNPNQEILPSEGMIVIFPADRYHSVKYEGTKDRIIVGVNFYSI